MVGSSVLHRIGKHSDQVLNIILQNTIRPNLTGVIQVDDGSVCQCGRWGSAANPTEVAGIIRVVAVIWWLYSVHLQRATHESLEILGVSEKLCDQINLE